ncbi:MAG: sigma-70 family RNA polymerase sigma factor [Saprospiraceae bacterium]|nr:sigma-70 family RNA polymerase sigma factor [Saprospiraceae bacterium]
MQDLEIIEKIRSGNVSVRNQAFHYLYHNERLWNKIRSILLPMGADSESLHELYQYAMIVIDRKIRDHNFQLTSSLETYFCSIVKNKFYFEKQNLSKQKKVVDISEIHESDFTETHYPDLDDEGFNQLLWSIVEKMNDRCKTLLPRWALGTNGDELCKEFGFSTIEQAKKETYRCRQKLKEYINGIPTLREKLLKLIR